MEKVRLVVKDVLGIMDGEGMALAILTDEAQTRQVTVICDQSVTAQAELRLRHRQAAHTMIPEVLCSVIRQRGGQPLEIMIYGLAGGQYQAVLYASDLLQPVPIRASEAVLLSIATGIPISMEATLMKRQSVPYKQNETGVALPVNILPRKMLRKALEKAVDDEDYVLASHLRDEINRRGGRKPANNDIDTTE